MTPPSHVMQSARHARKTVYLVAGVYVVIGFIVAVAFAVQGDRLGTFLGFLIVSGAMAMGLLFRAASQLSLRISSVDETLAGVRHRLDRIEGLMRGTPAARPSHTGLSNKGDLDLAEIGRGDPSLLSAATLDRDVYPRLVATMDGEPPAQSDDSDSSRSRKRRAAPYAPGDEPSDVEDAEQTVGLSTRNLLRQWKISLREDDLAGCRRVLSALIDTAGPDAVEPLRVQVAELADRVERELRKEFAAQVRSREYSSAISVGERMCSLLHDRPVTEEFARLRPLLERCAVRPVRRAAPPASAR